MCLYMDKEILYRFFEGKTTFEEEKQIREWMESSPDNTRSFYKERKMFDAMVLLCDGNNTTNKKATDKRKKYHFITEFVKIAAVIAITLGIGNLYHHYNSSQEETLMQTIFVPPGQRVNLSLPDGTNVWLNARTSMSYPVDFNKKDRQVELDGEAYFEVAKDNGRPFIVQTAKCDIEVLGTHFNVEAYSELQNFETTLMEGSVKVIPLSDPNCSVTLLPDNKASWHENQLIVEPVDDYTRYRWREGLICFKNESFESIMLDFEKYYGVTVKVNNQKALQSYYTGKFRHTDGIDYALRVLQKDIRFSYTRDDENQVIYIN